MRTITIRYTAFRECPNCEGRGTTAPPGALRSAGGAREGQARDRRRGRGLRRGVLPRSRYDFNALGEVYLLDFDEDEEFEVVRA